MDGGDTGGRAGIWKKGLWKKGLWKKGAVENGAVENGIVSSAGGQLIGLVAFWSVTCTASCGETGGGCSTV